MKLTNYLINHAPFRGLAPPFRWVFFSYIDRLGVKQQAFNNTSLALLGGPDLC